MSVKRKADELGIGGSEGGTTKRKFTLLTLDVVV